MRVRWLMLVAAVGCGWKQDIASLEGLVADRDAAMIAQEGTIADRDGEIARLTAEIGALKRSLSDQEANLAALESDLDEERARSARMMADKGALRAEIAATQAALADLEERKRQAEARVVAYRDLVQRFQKLIDAGKLDVRVVDGRMVVVLATDVLFPSGSADLSPEGQAALTEVGAVLGSIPENRYQIEGHTDDRPIKTTRFPSNWYLGAARAIGVVEHLLAHGLQAAQVSAAAFADTKPVASNVEEAGRAMNRRIEIVVVPDLSGLPGYDELQSL